MTLNGVKCVFNRFYCIHVAREKRIHYYTKANLYLCFCSPGIFYADSQMLLFLFDVKKKKKKGYESSGWVVSISVKT